MQSLPLSSTSSALTSQPRNPRGFRLTSMGLGLISLSLLSACMENPTQVDATDYRSMSVTSKTAGATLAGSFSSANNWSQTVTNPTDATVMESVLGSTQALGKKTALAKMARVAGDEMVITVDTVAGVAHITHNYSLLGVAIEDKADVKWDDKAQDQIDDNENVIGFSQSKHYLLGKVETAVFSDADGDQLVNALSETSKVKIVFTKVELGLTEVAVVVAGCGPDTNFKTETDNLIYQADWQRKKGSVVLAEASYLDGDKDGIVVNNADTSLVEVAFKEWNPMNRPLVSHLEAHATVRLFGKDNGDEPVQFGYTETLKTGRVNSVSMKNRFGEPAMIANDTLTVHFESKITNADDTLKYLAIDFVMNPGKDLKSDLDDSLYALHILSQKKIGFEREAEFHFWSDAAVAHGQEPKAGHFEGEATYANGKTASLKGSFSPAGFQAEYVGPEGDSASVGYSLLGTVKP
jgi:hypothetical protein